MPILAASPLPVPPRRLAPTHRSCRPWLLLLACAVCQGAGAARAQEGTFTNLVDTNTVSPGSGGATFTGFNYAAISGTNVVFQTNNGSNAVFSMSNDGSNLACIANNATVPAGGSSTLSSFSYTVVSGNHVWFSAAYTDSSNNSHPGIYAGTVGQYGASVVAQYGQTSPNDPTTTLNGFQFGPRSSGDAVTFFASSTNNGSAVYRGAAGSSTLTTVADRSTPLPPSESGAFRYFSGAPAVSGDNVVFQAVYLNNGNRGYGIYASNANGLRVLADNNTQAPGAGAPFAGNAFNYAPAVSGNNVAFEAFRPGGGYGVYEASIATGTLLRLADTTTIAPGHNGGTLGTFTDLQAPVINGDNVAFLGGVNGGNTLGLFLRPQGGDLVDVLNTGDAFLGSTVANLGIYLSAQALDGNNLVFTYVLSDGRSGVAEYTFGTAVPEPSTWAVVAIGAGIMGVVARRRGACRPGRCAR